MEKQREARLREVLENLVDLQEKIGEVRAEERQDYLRLFDKGKPDANAERRLNYSASMLSEAIESLYNAGREILCAVKGKSIKDIEAEKGGKCSKCSA